MKNWTCAVVACDSLALERHQSLTGSDRERLWLLCHRANLEGVADWLQKHAAAVADYQSATPSARKRKKAWRDRDVRLLLTYGAIIGIQQGKALLANPWLDWAQYGSSKREVLALAGRIYAELLEASIDYWPFEGPIPFDLPPEPTA